MQKSKHDASKKNIPLIDLDKQQKLIRKGIDQAIKKAYQSVLDSVEVV